MIASSQKLIDRIEQQEHEQVVEIVKEYYEKKDHIEQWNRYKAIDTEETFRSITERRWR